MKKYILLASHIKSVSPHDFDHWLYEYSTDGNCWYLMYVRSTLGHWVKIEIERRLTLEYAASYVSYSTHEYDTIDEVMSENFSLFL